MVSLVSTKWNYISNDGPVRNIVIKLHEGNSAMLVTQ